MDGALLVVGACLVALGLGAWIIEGPLGRWWRARHRSEDWTGEGNVR